MGKGFLVVIVVVLAVYSLFDVVATPRRSVRFLPRLLWVLVVLVPVVGALSWLAFGKVPHRPPNPPRRQNQAARGPDDDPDFLRGL